MRVAYVLHVCCVRAACRVARQNACKSDQHLLSRAKIHGRKLQRFKVQRNDLWYPAARFLSLAFLNNTGVPMIRKGFTRSLDCVCTVGI